MLSSLLAMLRPTNQLQGKFLAEKKEERTSSLLMSTTLAIVGIVLMALLFIQLNSLMASLIFVYDRVGLTTAGLIPLTVLVMFLLIYAITASNPRQPWVEGLLLFVQDMGQLLGGFGTLDGLWRGLVEFNLDQGAEGLLHALPALIGGIRIMAISNLWSISLVILTVVLHTLLFGLKKKEDPVVNPGKGGSDTASKTVIKDELPCQMLNPNPVIPSWQKNGR